MKVQAVSLAPQSREQVVKVDIGVSTVLQVALSQCSDGFVLLYEREKEVPQQGSIN